MDAGWDAADWQDLRLDNAWQWGQPTTSHTLSGRFAFLWDAEALYLRVRVVDAEVNNNASPDKLHRQDSVDLILDPQHDGMIWKDPDDFRICFAPTGKTYERFQQRAGFDSRVERTNDGYELRATLPWFFLNQHRPVAGQTLGVTVGVKSFDEEAGLLSLDWCTLGKKTPIRLGDLHLR